MERMAKIASKKMIFNKQAKTSIGSPIKQRGDYTH